MFQFDIRTRKCAYISLTFQSQCNVTFIHWLFLLILGVKVYNIYIYIYIYMYVYVIVVTQARVLCLIYARSPRAAGPRAHISGKARVLVLQLICYTSGSLKICPNLMLIFPSAYIVTDIDYDCGS